MITFLTSSPTKDLSPEQPWPALDERNGFVRQLKRIWPDSARCLMIAADPEACDLNDEMTGYYEEAVKRSGLPVACFDLWDIRGFDVSGEQLRGYDVIFLAGGYVPTERRWFEYLRLKEQLEGFAGIVIGTSAGSMNAACTVYAWPEREGESLDPAYELFFPGLGLTNCNILPHCQKVWDSWLDGKRYVQDIARSHSYGHSLLAIPDGSYVLVEDGVETVFGEAHLVADGQISCFCGEGERRRFC